MRLCIFVTHPVQYHVPLWRALAAHPGLDVHVFYFSDHSVRGDVDKGFGVAVKWDVDLLSGYRHTFLSRTADLAAPASVRIDDVHATLTRERPDWVWISGYTMGFERQLVREARKQGARIIMRAEFSDLSFGPRSVPKRIARLAYLRWFYSRVDAFCYPGELGRRHLIRHGVRDPQTFFSPYSVDNALIERSKLSLGRERARAALGIPGDRCVLLLSGKLIPRKAPCAVLDALTKLQSIERVGLVVLGDGELRDEFETRARNMLGDRLIFPGFVNQSQLGPFFVASDVLIMPSLHETWGLVVNEAMHYGLPAIVSDQVGCHTDLIVPGRTGFVAPTGDVDSLARHIQSFLEDPEMGRQMGIAAESHIRRYTIQSSAQGVLLALGLAPAASRGA
jgi:glycosyltransferase involved in cell wall biosynthesis